MAFLEADAKNVASGWGPEPKLEAPNIGPTLAAILANRLGQQKLTQDTLSDAIKAQQDRNQNAAYAQALQNAGLTSGQDISGLSGAQATAFAKAIQDQQKTSQDSYYDALTKILNDTGRRPPTGPLPAGQKPMTQGQEFQRLKTQDSVLGGQADTLEQQQADYGLTADVPSGFGYMKNKDGTYRYAATQEEQAKPDLVSPTDILKGVKNSMTGAVPNWTGGPTFTSDVYKQRQSQSDSLKQILAEQDRVRKQILAPQGINQPDVDQAAQAQGLQPGASAPPPASTATPPPYSQSIPTPTPGASPSASPTGPKIASGYGVDATNMSADDVRSAYQAGKMSRAEAQARLKQLGFSD